AAVAGLVLSLANSSATLAITSNWADPHVWDKDNDNIPGEFGDSQIAFSRGGSSWTSTKTNRFTEALAAWSANTDWNPSHDASDTTAQRVYVDGTEPIAF